LTYQCAYVIRFNIHTYIISVPNNHGTNPDIIYTHTFWWTFTTDWLGPKVGDHLAPFLYSSRELSELSQWLCHDDSTINIFVLIIIIITIIYLFIVRCFLVKMSYAAGSRDAAGRTLILIRCSNPAWTTDNTSRLSDILSHFFSSCLSNAYVWFSAVFVNKMKWLWSLTLSCWFRGFYILFFFRHY